MIKQLITDLAHDNIKLSQALTMSKLIAVKIGNDKFKNWLVKELEGYNFNDEYLPNYRRIYSPIFIKVEFPYNGTRIFPVILPDKLEKEIGEIIYFQNIVEPISIIEQQILGFETSKGYINILPTQLQILSEMYKKQINAYNGVLTSGYREIGKVQYQNILELTKQKLLDTLLELDKEFPNLNNEYKMTKENEEKIQNIITNNIYGNSGSMNIAAGQNIKQSNDYIIMSHDDEEKLKSLGVDEKHIEEIKTIILEDSTDKNSLKKRVMKWLGSVSAAVAARGLYDNIPAIMEFVQKYI